MRATSLTLLLAIVTSGILLENVVFFFPHGLNPVVMLAAGVVGVVGGVFAANSTVQALERQGKYRPGWKRNLIGFGLVAVVVIVFAYVGLSGGVTGLWSLFSLFYSAYVAVPVACVGGLLVYRRWELAKEMEIRVEGSWIGTFYAVPKRQALQVPPQQSG